MMAPNQKFVLAIASFLAFSGVLACAQIALPCPNENSTEKCELPNCRCSGTEPPTLGTPGTIPQLVFLTFDDAVNPDNYPFYQDLIYNRKNPNGEPITTTFFITHEYTNYSNIHELWRRGHEIAFHSITHTPLTTYWANLNETGWIREIVDQKSQVAQFARVTANDIKGMRAPFLEAGGDAMYTALAKNGFQWECSRPTLLYRNPGLWPYTNDYESVQDCQVGTCPKGKYPGFWTVPMIDLIGGNGEGCAMADACIPQPITADGTFDLLKQNFDIQRNGNKAPFGIYIHAGWVNGTGKDAEEQAQIDRRRDGFERFLDHLATLNDTYIVGISRGLEWIKNPTPAENLANFDPFKVVVKQSNCPAPNDCPYPPELTPFPTERWMNTCGSCPQRYPWVGNPLGRP